MTQEIVYLQKEFNGLPAGTPLVGMDRVPPEAQVARALVGQPREPDTWYRIQGTQVPVRIPLFQGLVDRHHPTAKEVVGPFVSNVVLFGLDKLSDDVSAHISLVKEMYDYPEVVIRVCVNTVQEDGQVIRDELDNLPPVLSIDGEVLTRDIIRERVSRMLGDADLKERLKSNTTGLLMGSSSAWKGGV